jgi:hypothetical protein
MEKIKDYNTYNLGMKKSIRDKLFWEGLIDDHVTGICDFGCADGQLLAMVHSDFPEWSLYGVDNDPHMRDLATEVIPEAMVFDRLTAMCNITNQDHQILSITSVIHEVYSYCSEEEIDHFWDDVFSIGYRYVAIREFALSRTVNGVTDINDYQKLLAKGFPEQIADFESIWGSVHDRKNMIHCLMKYRYLANWSREVRENYFPISLEDLLAKIPDTYEIMYFNHFSLPFNREKIREDFGIELKDNTHVKLLLKRKEK